MHSELLVNLRHDCGFTQEEAAERLDINVHTLQNRERTGNFRRPEDLHAMLDLYGADEETRRRVILEVYGDGRNNKVADCLFEK